jgi:hypothetical protein
VLVSIVQLARPGMDLRDRELSRQAAAATRARRMAQLRTKGTARDLAAGARSYVEESGKREPADSFPGLDAPAPAAAIHDPAQQLALLLDNQRQQPYVAAPAASAQSFQARLSRMQEYLVSESEPEVPELLINLSPASSAVSTTEEPFDAYHSRPLPPRRRRVPDVASLLGLPGHEETADNFTDVGASSSSASPPVQSAGARAPEASSTEMDVV